MLIGQTKLYICNQISRNLSHGNPMDMAKCSPNASKREYLAGEDAIMQAAGQARSLVWVSTFINNVTVNIMLSEFRIKVIECLILLKGHIHSQYSTTFHDLCIAITSLASPVYFKYYI
jgi:hypothetical protein